MGQELTLTIPDEVYQSLSRIGQLTLQRPEEVAVDMLIGGIREHDDNPLLKLAGCIECDPEVARDAIENHDYWFGHTLTEEEEARLRRDDDA